MTDDLFSACADHSSGGIWASTGGSRLERVESFVSIGGGKMDRYLACFDTFLEGNQQDHKRS